MGNYYDYYSDAITGYFDQDVESDSPLKLKEVKNFKARKPPLRGDGHNGSNNFSCLEYIPDFPSDKDEEKRVGVLTYAFYRSSILTFMNLSDGKLVYHYDTMNTNDPQLPDLFQMVGEEKMSGRYDLRFFAGEFKSGAPGLNNTSCLKYFYEPGYLVLRHNLSIVAWNMRKLTVRRMKLEFFNDRNQSCSNYDDCRFLYVRGSRQFVTPSLNGLMFLDLDKGEVVKEISLRRDFGWKTKDLCLFEKKKWIGLVRYYRIRGWFNGVKYEFRTQFYSLLDDLPVKEEHSIDTGIDQIPGQYYDGFLVYVKYVYNRYDRKEMYLVGSVQTPSYLVELETGQYKKIEGTACSAYNLVYNANLFLSCCGKKKKKNSLSIINLLAGKVIGNVKSFGHLKNTACFVEDYRIACFEADDDVLNGPDIRIFELENVVELFGKKQVLPWEKKFGSENLAIIEKDTLERMIFLGQILQDEEEEEFGVFKLGFSDGKSIRAFRINLL